MGFAMLEAERVIVAVSDGRTALPPDVQSRAFSAYTAGIFLMGLRLSQRLTVHRALGQQVRHVLLETPTRIDVTPKNPVLGRTAGLKLVWERTG